MTTQPRKDRMFLHNTDKHIINQQTSISKACDARKRMGSKRINTQWVSRAEWEIKRISMPLVWHISEITECCACKKYWGEMRVQGAWRIGSARQDRIKKLWRSVGWVGDFLCNAGPHCYLSFSFSALFQRIMYLQRSIYE